MEQITKIPVYKSERIYQVCKDFITLYPETGEKIFDTFKSQFNEAALKLNSVNTIVQVVYQINWGDTEEGFLWWDEFYTHLKKILEEQLDGEKNN